METEGKFTSENGKMYFLTMKIKRKLQKKSLKKYWKAMKKVF